MPRNQGGIVWVRDSLTPGLAQMPSKLKLALSKALESEAPRVQSYMQRNATWTDRTGAARNGLGAEFIGDRNFDRLAIRVFHGVPYGIFLETRFAGKYAIIVPTLVAEGDRIMGSLGNLMGGMTGSVSFSPGAGFASGLSA